MSGKSKIRNKVTVSLVFSVISSFPILLCLINVKSDAAEKVLIYIASSMFWVGLILEQGFLWAANSERKKAEKEKKQKGTYPGIISFFKTKLGKISDIVFLASVVAFIIMSSVKISINIGQFIVLFLIVLSFRLHCIANGKNYSYKSETKKRGAKK